MKRKALPDSIAANPEVGKLLTKLFATKKIKTDTTPREIYTDAKYEDIMGPVNWEKFRKHFVAMYKDNFGACATKGTMVHIYMYIFILIYT